MIANFNLRDVPVFALLEIVSVAYQTRREYTK